jgi:chitin disaccharide deacetylase
VTSTSLLVNGSAARAAADAARSRPALSVGLHFAEDDPGILDDPAALHGAFAAQLETFRALMGRDPTHVDSHHHVHLSRIAEFAPLVAPLGVPLRGDGRVHYAGEFYGQPIPGQTDLSKLSRAHLISVVSAAAGHPTVELGTHPGIVSHELSSSYRVEREVELRTLTEPGLREELEALGFRLASFADA